MIWDRLELGLQRLAEDRLELGMQGLSEQKYEDNIPNMNLIIAVIISAGRDQDLSYLGTDEFLYHCYLVGLNADNVAYMMEQTWRHINNNMAVQQEGVIYEDEGDL